MEKEILKFETSIDAPKEKVWDVLLQDETYRQWTTPFCEGSYYEADNLQPGSKVKFLSPQGEGMVSRVAVHKPNEEISFEHLGVVKDGKEDTESEAVKEWKGSRETYRVKPHHAGTQLQIEQDIDSKHAPMFTTMWQAALQKVKELSEA
jgi:uncharacterized protein YndB with AHSA1/START domain